jgi:hypothetical protein
VILDYGFSCVMILDYGFSNSLSTGCPATFVTLLETPLFVVRPSERLMSHIAC